MISYDKSSDKLSEVSEDSDTEDMEEAMPKSAFLEPKQICNLKIIMHHSADKRAKHKKKPSGKMKLSKNQIQVRKNLISSKLKQDLMQSN